MVNQVPNKDEQTSKATTATGKKPYQRPVLTSLGSLRDMTMTIHAGGVPDGGKKQNTGRGGLYTVVESDS